MKRKANLSQIQETAAKPALMLVRPMQGPFLTYQQEQYIRQRAMLEEIRAKAPTPVAPWAVMYPKL